jgi:hypothetical protein
VWEENIVNMKISQELKDERADFVLIEDPAPDVLL